MRRKRFNRTCFLVLVALLSSFLSLKDVRGYEATIQVELSNGYSRQISYNTYVSEKFLNYKDDNYICTLHDPPSTCRYTCNSYWLDGSGNRGCYPIFSYCSNPMYSENDICTKLQEEQNKYVGGKCNKSICTRSFFKGEDDNGKYIEFERNLDIDAKDISSYVPSYAREQILKIKRIIRKDSIFEKYNLVTYGNLSIFTASNQSYSDSMFNDYNNYTLCKNNPSLPSCSSYVSVTVSVTYETACKDPLKYTHDTNDYMYDSMLNSLISICNWFMEGVYSEGSLDYNSGYSTGGITNIYNNAFNGQICSGSTVPPVSTMTGDTVGNISFSYNASSEYGPIQQVATYPGGPYTTWFTFGAAYSYTYISSYKCKFVRYLHGGSPHHVTCGEVSGPTSFFGTGITPSVGDSWKKHPDTVTLTEIEKLSGVKVVGAEDVTMKFTETTDCSGISPSVHSAGGVYKVNGAPSNATQIEQSDISEGLQNQNTNNNEILGGIDGEGSYTAVDTNGDGEIDENEQYTAYHTRKVTIAGSEMQNVSSGNYCGNNSTKIDIDLDAIAARTKAAYESSHAHTEASVGCYMNIEDKGTCECNDNGKNCKTYYSYKIVCNINWDASYVIYSIPQYETKSEQYCGRYEITDSKNSITERFEITTAKKYTPISILTGDYYYKISGNDGFGWRRCDLYIKAPICTGPNCDDSCVGADCIPVTPCEGDYCGKHWSDFLYFRNVEVASLFPNRQPGRNWVGYDTSIVSSKQTDVMYHIELSSSTMKKIAKDTNIDNYVGWKLNSSYKPSYLNSSNIYEYDWSHDHGYSSLGDLRNLGATIIENREIIEKRNKELIKSDYNKYNTGK